MRTAVLNGPPVREVIRVWPRPSCWRLTPGEGWVERRPWIHTRFADEPWPHRGEGDLRDLRGWNPRVEGLLEAVPRTVRKVLRPLCDRICWAALKLVAAVPGVMALARDNLSLVALLALTAEKAVRASRVFEQVQAGSAGRRRDLLPLAGLPSSKTLLPVLSKLDPEALSRPGPDAVVELLLHSESEVTKPLRHLPAIRSDLVQVLLAPELRRLCSYALLADEGGPIRWGLHTALDEIVAAREDDRASPSPARFSSRREVADFCQTIDPFPARRWNPSSFRVTFDPPAGEQMLPGEPPVTLRPITSATDILEHGVRKKLCIARDDYYPDCVRMGEGALFEVDWTTEEGLRREATAWVRRAWKGWRLSELRGPANRQVPQWLLDRLWDWAQDLEPETIVDEPVEPLLPPEPEPQLRLPLRWSSSPLDSPAFGRTTGAKRPLMEYDDWWETEAWLVDWQSL